MAEFKQAVFKESELRSVRGAPPSDNPPLAIGDKCWHLSGGPRLLVVDVHGDDLVVAWRDEGKPVEAATIRACVRRIKYFPRNS